MKNSCDILLIDDDKGMTSSLATLLHHSGYKAATANSLHAGLEILESQHFDIVVTDYYLGDGQASEIMAYCKEFCPNTKVIVMTGSASIETAVEAIRNGAFDYVVKPFDFDLLYHSINRAAEHLQMSGEIALARERYKALIEDLHEGFMVIRDDFQPIFLNAKMAQILCSDEKSILNSNIWEYVDPASHTLLREKITMILKSPGAIYLEELVFRDRRKNPVPVEVRLTNTLGDFLGNGVMLICSEITERDELWRRLVKAERLAIMGEMVANVAHELNNKLTPILGFSEILSEADLLSREEVTRCANGINKAANGAKRIVESLLLFARQEKPAKKICNLNHTISSAVDLSRAWIGISDLSIEFHLKDEEILIKADSDQIEQAITNILKNAIEALSGHQGRIVVSSALSMDGKRAVVTIQDNGPGIPEEIQDRIFMPFFSTKSKKQGTGLGLSICHGIIKEHGGSIDLISRPGKTVFTITLPAADEKQINTAQEPPVKNPPLEFSEKKRILIVDDEPEISNLMAEVFTPSFDIELAQDGVDALEKLNQKSFDIIISDVKMPRMDGVDLYRILEDEQQKYCSRFIFTTGIASDFKTQQFLEEREIPYIQKPFKLQDLINAVYALLDSSHQGKGTDGPDSVPENQNNLH